MSIHFLLVSIVLIQVLFGILLVVYGPNLDPYLGYSVMHAEPLTTANMKLFLEKSKFVLRGMLIYFPVVLSKTKWSLMPGVIGYPSGSSLLVLLAFC